MTTPCREWLGYRMPHGYGQKRDKTTGKTVQVHRWVMAQIDGWEAIEGKVVMHLCDNTACYRYDHLRIGTQAENLADMRVKGRAANGNEVKTHCPEGHPYNETNTRIVERPDRAPYRVCRICSRQNLRNSRASRREKR